MSSILISDIILIDSVLDKLIWKHSLSEKELRQTLINNPKIRRIEKGKIKGEDLYAALGRTDSGRYVIVFFIHKKNNKALIVTSRDMTEKERRMYERK